MAVRAQELGLAVAIYTLSLTQLPPEPVLAGMRELQAVLGEAAEEGVLPRLHGHPHPALVEPAGRVEAVLAQLPANDCYRMMHHLFQLHCELPGHDAWILRGIPENMARRSSSDNSAVGLRPAITSGGKRASTRWWSWSN